MNTPTNAAELPESEREAFEAWLTKLTPDDRYDFDSEGRGFKKPSGSMMWLAWQARAALSTQPAPARVALTEEQSIRDMARLFGFNEYEGLSSRWVSSTFTPDEIVAFARAIERAHGITASNKEGE